MEFATYHAYTDRLISEGLAARIETHPTSRDVRMLVPHGDNDAQPLVTILVPALNEGITISKFMEWCKQGIAGLDGVAEILIIDASDDETPRIVLQNGGRVVRAPKRGLGRAYIDAFSFARGKYLILGDADCTYDFRELKPFVDKLKAGADFVMGSRFLGSIEKGAMPKSHQYFGTPLTTAFLNLIYGTKYSDIHCGMRGLSRHALEVISLQSQSWEYASEMVIKAAIKGLKVDEVPINFYKDNNGRVSVHKREGWFSPIKAAWINIQAMMLYGGNRLAKAAAYPLLVVGGFMSFVLFFSAFEIFGLALGLVGHAVGLGLLTCGLALKLGDSLFEALHEDEIPTARDGWAHRLLRYDFAMLLVNALFWTGTFILAIYTFQIIGVLNDIIGAHFALSALGMMMISITLFINAVLYQVVTHQSNRVRTHKFGLNTKAIGRKTVQEA